MTVTIWQPGTTATHDQRVSAAGVFCIQRFNEIQYTAYSTELSMGPFRVTQANPTHGQL